MISPNWPQEKPLQPRGSSDTPVNKNMQNQVYKSAYEVRTCASVRNFVIYIYVSNSCFKLLDKQGNNIPSWRPLKISVFLYLMARRASKCTYCCHEYNNNDS